MLPQAPPTDRAHRSRQTLATGLAALGALLAASGAQSQNQQYQQYQQYQQHPTQSRQQPQQRSTTAPAPRTTTTPGAPHAQSGLPQGSQPANSVNRATGTNQTRNLFNNLFSTGNNAGHTNNPSGATNPSQSGSLLHNLLPQGNNAGNSAARSQTAPKANQFTNTPGNSLQRRALPNAAGAAGVTPGISTRNPTNSTRIASLNAAVPSRTFPGHPGPPGSTETQFPNGNIVRKAADGSVLDVRSPRNGMTIHHGLDGSRQVVVDRPDRSRIFATTRGVPYVQHPYVFRGRTYDHRTYYAQGHTAHYLYRPYTYGATTLDAYATTRFYEPRFYQFWVSRFNMPVRNTWAYTTTPTPWYTYYRSYFTPDPSYTSPLGWLTDFVLASSLALAYTTEPPASPAPSPDHPAAPITPQAKQKLAEEIGRQVKQESVEAEENARNTDAPAGTGSVVQELSDGQEHTYSAVSDLDLIDATGRRCMLSAPDVVSVVSQPNPATGTADAVVISSKGGVECESSARVAIALTDLQEMRNHMRAAIDQGMASSEPGKKAASVTPAFAASAPPPDANAASEIAQQQQIAAAAEG